MKSEKRILIAFLLNLAFSVFEFIGGIYTGSVAIISDAVHDVGDAASIGVSFLLERKSKKPPDEAYTYGYIGYSVIGGVITTLLLLFGSVAVIYNAVLRILHPTEVNYNGMIVLAVVGVGVNLTAALLTREGDSLNQRAVNLHMLEDVLGWVVVLLGAVVMRFTGFYLIDPLMSVGVALFILVSAARELWEAVELFLGKTPRGIDVSEIREHICGIDGILDVHHVHVWSIDGRCRYATMHVVTDRAASEVKAAVRAELAEHGIIHATLELEGAGEECRDRHCRVVHGDAPRHHHYHHH